MRKIVNVIAVIIGQTEKRAQGTLGCGRRPGADGLDLGGIHRYPLSADQVPEKIEFGQEKRAFGRLREEMMFAQGL